MLTHGIPPGFRDGVHFYRQPPSGQSRVYRVTQLRTAGVHCREPAGTGQVVIVIALKVAPVTDAAFSDFPMDIFLRVPLFPHPLLMVCNGHV